MANSLLSQQNHRCNSERCLSRSSQRFLQPHDKKGKGKIQICKNYPDISQVLSLLLLVFGFVCFLIQQTLVASRDYPIGASALSDLGRSARRGRSHLLRWSHSLQKAFIRLENRKCPPNLQNADIFIGYEVISTDFTAGDWIRQPSIRVDLLLNYIHNTIFVSAIFHLLSERTSSFKKYQTPLCSLNA